MVKHYTFLAFTLVINMLSGQSPCDNANSDLIYAYSNIKSAYDSNNVDHLKYYSDRSKGSFERSKEHLKNCGCQTAYDLAYDAIELLKKVEPAETFEDGRFYVKQVKEIAQESITALDKCTIQGDDFIADASNENLSSLQMEQEKLKQQQLELKRKAEEINAKLAEQNELALKLEKEEMIKSFESVVSKNVESYNSTLKACNCDFKPISKSENDTNIYSKSLEEIKLYYLNSLKKLTSNYLSQLNACN
ncbi:hypothetical protein KO566_10185 [Flavobacteriaceae bacterium XHP0103]|uniref:hypothetical protein n=1 Tax=Marixanthotalea marina TaxID=2844359 RepID=UPI002989B4FD|nr:hypothetical protein [Marixanthotalea marina]MBU3822430.1 hypothetical protein [Marixanthotalea marina]